MSAGQVTYRPGAVILYRGKAGIPWIAWAGHDSYYEECWYTQRRDSVYPGQPRAVSHDELLDEIGSRLIILSDGSEHDDA